MKRKEVEFGILKVGDKFYHQRRIHIKIAEDWVGIKATFPAGGNAIVISNGKLMTIKNKAIIRPVKIRFFIK